MLAGLRSDVKCRDNNLLQNLNSLLESFPEGNGDDGDRTRNLRLAKPALSQLSYIPPVGVRGFEPRTSALSELRSSQLSYTPSQNRCRFRLAFTMLESFPAKFKWRPLHFSALSCGTV